MNVENQSDTAPLMHLPEPGGEKMLTVTVEEY